MKKYIKRVLVGCCAAMLTLGVCAGMSGCSTYSMYSQNTSHVTSEGKYYITSDAEDLDNISNITVNWPNGTVKVVETNDEYISMKESGSSSEDTTMHYNIKNTSIEVLETATDYTGSVPEKELTIYVPSDDYLEYLEVNGDKVAVDVESEMVRNILIDTDADVTVKGCDLTTMYEIYAGSGSIKVSLPKDLNATVKGETTSTKITSTFGTANADGEYVYGTGKAKVILGSTGSISVGTL